ncbi:hypothetical protein L1080_001405 [Rhodococcus sp. MSC1_016]|jgi:high-affinity Fe2+/Pb2+ permease|uniref:hypothetical protein n=1 Tax=Rhodococcus sp. MSC1_016 TaxID=2909266 RepID=UPI002030EA7B|nr:hypothetical protein [Rhodococcus sp. MSC1_016]
MRTFAFTAGAAAIVAVVLVTTANRVFYDMDTARFILNFGVAAAATCCGLLYLGTMLLTAAQHSVFLDDRTEYRP